MAKSKTKKATKVRRNTHPIGSNAYKAYLRRKEAERRKRGFIDRSRKKRDESGLAGGPGSPGRRKVKKRGAH